MNETIYTVGGYLWINLVNTEYVSKNEIVDVLQNETLTYQWLKENQLIDIEKKEDGVKMVQEGSLTSLLLRLRQLFSQIIQDIEDENVVNESTIGELQAFILSTRIELSLDIEYNDDTLKLIHKCQTKEDSIIYNIIESFFDSYNAYSPERIKQCNHEECVLHFIDTSKSGKRKWCSMERCGNRKKVTAFYQRNSKKKTNQITEK